MIITSFVRIFLTVSCVVFASNSAASKARITLVPPSGHQPDEFWPNFKGHFRKTESLSSNADCMSFIYLISGIDSCKTYSDIRVNTVPSR